jgi:hypothetical protein
MTAEVLEKMSNRHRLLAMLIETGLRVTQVVNLTYKNFNFETRQLSIEGKTPKVIELNGEVYETLRLYVDEVKPETLDKFLFESPDRPDKHITRQSVNLYLQRFAHKKGLEHITPKSLRTGTEPKQREVLEFETVQETPNKEAKTSKLTLRELVANHKKEVTPIPLNLEQTALVPQNLLIGRQDTIEQANTILAKGLNLIITGETGTGKNRLLDSLAYPLPVLEFDDTKDFKKNLANAILFLLKGDEDQARAKVFGNASDEEVYTKITKESMVNLAHVLCDLVPKKAYILRITDVSDVTPLVIRILKERLVEHFVIVTTAREIRKDRSDFLWSFERIELKNLKRADSIQLTYQLCERLPVEDFTYLKNKVYHVSQGNPRMITQICERISREFGLIQNWVIDKICNSYLGKRIRELDMSFLLIGICLIAFFVAWYRTGAEREFYRYARYCIIVFLLFGRAFFAQFKRKII